VHCWTHRGARRRAGGALIHADAIDILVDLSGHTRGNRPGRIRAKPAPVQIGYLVISTPPAWPAMDYRSPIQRRPAGRERSALHSETLLRLPQTLWATSRLRRA